MSNVVKSCNIRSDGRLLSATPRAGSLSNASAFFPTTPWSWSHPISLQVYTLSSCRQLSKRLLCFRSSTRC